MGGYGEASGAANYRLAPRRAGHMAPTGSHGDFKKAVVHSSAATDGHHRPHRGAHVAGALDVARGTATRAAARAVAAWRAARSLFHRAIAGGRRATPTSSRKL